MSSKKIDTFLAKDELPGFFRQLADTLENGGSDEFTCAEEFKKLKISVKDRFGQVSVRVKFTSGEDCQPEFDVTDGSVEGSSAKNAKPRYSVLKKQMKESFGMIFKMIHQGKLPPKDAVATFLAESELMVSYPGYGDDYYAVYTEACDTFAKAYESGDIVKLNEAVDVLVHQKAHCHAKYK